MLNEPFNQDYSSTFDIFHSSNKATKTKTLSTTNSITILPE